MSARKKNPWLTILIEIATFLNFFSTASNSYWLAEFFNYGIQQDENEDAIGLSRYAIAFGLAVGIYAAIGFVFSHRALYKHEQLPLDDNNLQESFVINIGSEDEEEKKLSCSQIAILAGCNISCAIGVAGPLCLMFEIATAGTGIKLPRAAILGTYSFFLAGGMLAAYGETRACKNAMLKANNPSADKWTKMTAAGEALGVFDSGYLLQNLFGLIMEQQKGDLGLYYDALPFALLIGILSTIGEAYTHWNVNTHAGVSDDASTNLAGKLSLKNKLALIGDVIAQDVEFMSMLFTIKLMLHKNPLTPTREKWTIAGLGFAGLFNAVVDARKGYQTMDKILDSQNPSQSASATSSPRGITDNNAQSLPLPTNLMLHDDTTTMSSHHTQLTP